jgi:enamine deaminase RidA (YjgF/YER057c/UK114 family)
MSIKRHEPSKILSSAVEANGFAFLAGITPKTLTKDIKGQTEEVVAEIDRLLKVCGTDKSKIVSATIWLNDIRHRDLMNEVWIAWTGGQNLPVRACVEAKLADQRMLVEIQVTAVQ